MLLKNKTGRYQKVRFSDGRIDSIRPYRTMQVPEGTQYNERKVEIVSVVQPNKASKTKTKSDE